MRLFLGNENLLSYSNLHYSIGQWDTNTAGIKGVIISPDGSTYAISYTGDNASWDYVRTDEALLPLPTHESMAYLISFYAKADTAYRTRVLSYLYDNVSEYWGLAIEFEDNTLSSCESVAGANHYGVANFGRNYVGNGWYKFWGLHDVRDNKFVAAQNCELRIFINPNGDEAKDVGSAIWGVRIEKTNRRNYPTPLRITDGTAHNGLDYTMVEFTQLPSNIDEVDNNLFSTTKDSLGNIIRREVSVDDRVHKLIWNRINYKTHGHMIYVMREALRDKAKRDCILEYPHTIKRHIRSADIRVTNFVFNYLPTPNMATVEMHYIIMNTYLY